MMDAGGILTPRGHGSPDRPYSGAYELVEGVVADGVQAGAGSSPVQLTETTGEAEPGPSRAVELLSLSLAVLALVAVGACAPQPGSSKPPLPTAPSGADVESAATASQADAEVTPLLPISPANAERVSQVARWGKGTVVGLAYSPDGRVLAVG